jgi:hypothetical protein
LREEKIVAAIKAHQLEAVLEGVLTISADDSVIRGVPARGAI